MGVTSYPTSLDAHFTDIELVGGKNSVVGQIREEPSGKKYVLVKAGVETANGIICYLLGEYLTALCAATTNLPAGVNTTGATIAAAEYFWLQYEGEALVQTDGSVATSNSVVGATGGVGDGLAVNTGSGMNHALGIAKETDYGSDPYWALVWIRPHSWYVAP